MGQFHALAQIVGAMVLERDALLIEPTSLKLLEITTIALLRVHFNEALGAVHGAFWYWASHGLNTSQVLVPLILKNTAGLHGIGHGFLFAQSTSSGSQKYTACSRPPMFHCISSVHRAAAMCVSLPALYMISGCLFGMYHSVFEYSSGLAQHGQDFPCDDPRLPMPVHCWRMLFGVGLWSAGGRLDFSRATQLAYSMDGQALLYCLRKSTSMGIVGGCLCGMSSAFFAYFHEAWAADKQFGSPLDACLKCPLHWTITSTPSAVCPLVVRSLSALTMVNSRSSLIGWCSAIIATPENGVSHEELGHWLACILGSLHSMSSSEQQSANKWSADDFAWLCQHDLSFQVHNGTWKAIQGWCEGQIGSATFWPSRMMTSFIGDKYEEIMGFGVHR